MYIFLSIIYVLVCLFLILVVLLQQGKGGGMGGAFGGSSQTVFGGAGAGNVLTRATTASAALFMILSAVLAWMSSSRDAALEDVLREVEDRNRGALLEAAEDSTSDHAEEATDEAVIPPAGEPTTEEAGDEALVDPTAGLEGPAGEALELPELELGGDLAEPGVPTLGEGGGLRLEAPAAEAPAAEAPAAEAHAAEAPAEAPAAEAPAPATH